MIKEMQLVISFFHVFIFVILFAFFLYYLDNIFLYDYFWVVYCGNIVFNILIFLYTLDKLPKYLLLIFKYYSLLFFVANIIYFIISTVRLINNNYYYLIRSLINAIEK